MRAIGAGGAEKNLDKMIAALIGPEAWRQALDQARVAPGTRSLRLRTDDTTCTVEDDAATVSFALPRGAFATAVIREICAT